MAARGSSYGSRPRPDAGRLALLNEVPLSDDEAGYVGACEQTGAGARDTG